MAIDFRRRLSLFKRVMLFFVLLKLVAFLWGLVDIASSGVADEWALAAGLADESAGIFECRGIPGPLEVYLPRLREAYVNISDAGDGDFARDCRMFGGSSYLTGLYMQQSAFAETRAVDAVVRERGQWFAAVLIFAGACLLFELIKLFSDDELPALGLISASQLFYVMNQFGINTYIYVLEGDFIAALAIPTVWMGVFVSWCAVVLPARWVLENDKVEALQPYKQRILIVLKLAHAVVFLVPLVGYLVITVVFYWYVLFSGSQPDALGSVGRLAGIGASNAAIGLLQLAVKASVLWWACFSHHVLRRETQQSRPPAGRSGENQPGEISLSVQHAPAEGGDGGPLPPQR